MFMVECFIDPGHDDASLDIVLHLHWLWNDHNRSIDGVALDCLKGLVYFI